MLKKECYVNGKPLIIFCRILNYIKIHSVSLFQAHIHAYTHVRTHKHTNTDPHTLTHLRKRFKRKAKKRENQTCLIRFEDKCRLNSLLCISKILLRKNMITVAIQKLEFLCQYIKHTETHSNAYTHTHTYTNAHT